MKRYESWGRYPAASPVRVEVLRWVPEILPITDTETVLAYGLGRSQGDSCLNDGGVLLDTSPLNRFIAFDANQGTLTAEAGVTLAQILDLIVPQGWFLPVIPGTKHVTLGGAIANDIHGKNHRTAGSFGNHVREFTLLRSDGKKICSLAQNADLFAATIGGLGLTGLITQATLQLKRVASPWITVNSVPFTTIAEGIALIQAQSAQHEYVVGQFDALPNSRGKGVLMVGDQAPVDSSGQTPKGKAITVPFVAPNWLLNDLDMRAFNWWYNRHQVHLGQRTVHYTPYFFPLDSINYWNRLYGSRGFVQSQPVVPASRAGEVYAKILQLITTARHGSYLASLKLFGDKKSVGMLSWPRPGIVIALDFPFKGEQTLKLLEECDVLVREAGGAVYPAKDTRMSAHSFQAYYPRWQEFSRHIDPRFSSSFWRRVTNKFA